MFKIQTISVKTGDWVDFSTGYQTRQEADDAIFAFRMTPTHAGRQFKVVADPVR